MQLEVSRKRRKFGQPCTFGDKDASDTYNECKSFRDPNFETERVCSDAAIQAIPETCASSAQTTWFRPQNTAIQYEPLTLSSERQREIEGSQSLFTFFRTVYPRLLKPLEQNAILDLFEDDYKLLGDEEISYSHGVSNTLQEFQTFMDITRSKDRSINAVDWHPTQQGIVADARIRRATLDERFDTGLNVRPKQAVILLWSFQDPNHPRVRN